MGQVQRRTNLQVQRGAKQLPRRGHAGPGLDLHPVLGHRHPRQDRVRTVVLQSQEPQLVGRGGLGQVGHDPRPDRGQDQRVHGELPHREDHHGLRWAGPRRRHALSHDPRSVHHQRREVREAGVHHVLQRRPEAGPDQGEGWVAVGEGVGRLDVRQERRGEQDRQERPRGRGPVRLPPRALVPVRAARREKGLHRRRSDERLLGQAGSRSAKAGRGRQSGSLRQLRLLE